MFNILIAEDDPKQRLIIRALLEKNGYCVIEACNGRRALEIMYEKYIDLIISDIMMPDMDGYEFISEVRKASFVQPVLIITAKDSFLDKQRGFFAGTDDYMVKPIDLNELLLRVGALLRRAKIANERRLVIGSVVLDYDSMTINAFNETIEMPQKEFLLLYKILSYPGKIFTRQQLMDEIWGFESDTDERTVDVHINRLRDRCEKFKDFEIVTVRGLGYKAVINIEQKKEKR